MNDPLDPFDRHFDSLEELADAISDVLQHPVTIEDDNHRLVAYSSHPAQTDTARVATIIGRRVPEPVIRALWQDGIMQRIMESDEPVSVSAIASVGLGNRLVVAIRRQRAILGYIWVLETDRRLGKEVSGALKQAAHAAATKLLQLQVRKRKKERGYEDFFWQLLTGHLTTTAEIREKAAALGVELPPAYRVVVLEFQTDIRDRQQPIEYMLTSSQRLSVLFYTLKQHQLIVLSGFKRGRSPADPEAAEFQDVPGQMQQRFGFAPSGMGGGSVYDDYTRVERSYREALTALNIRRQFPDETRGVFDYPSLGYYRFLPAMLAESRHHPVENRCLAALRQYDLEHHGDLLHTLETFLRVDSNLKTAAEALHVHVNTLSYRLKRIEDIGEIDLNDTDQKVTAFLDLKLLRLLRSAADFPHDPERPDL